MVFVELLLRLTEPCDGRPVGGCKPGSGSGRAAAPVTGLGLSDAPPETLTPPTTWMLVPFTVPLPLATRAEDDLESTYTRPPFTPFTLIVDAP